MAFIGIAITPGGFREAFSDQIAITWDDLDSSRGYVSGRLRNLTQRTLTDVRIRAVSIPRLVLGDNRLEEDWADFQPWSPGYGSRTGNEVIAGGSVPESERKLAPGAEIAFTIPLQYLNHLEFPVTLTVTENNGISQKHELSFTQTYQGRTESGR